MTTNGTMASEDTGMVDCEEGKVVTMMDVLQEQQEFEEDANAVLGASDDKNCTYPKGYIKRQAIYACLTCCFEAKDDPSKRAGVCLACSLTCHENHELIELYTKRNFRCDCGNPKFNSNPCQFTSNKPDLNQENQYNQNFSGLYCVCHRPYPDPEIPEEDEMIQCIICEDWLHSSHLEAVVPGNDQYSEMVCKACMETNDFLHDYSHLAVNVDNEDIEITVNGKIHNDSDQKSEPLPESTQNVTKDVSSIDETKDLVKSTVKENKDDKITDENINVEQVTDTESNEKDVTNETEMDTKLDTMIEQIPEKDIPAQNNEDMSDTIIEADKASVSAIPSEDNNSEKKEHNKSQPENKLQELSTVENTNEDSKLNQSLTSSSQEEAEKLSLSKNDDQNVEKTDTATNNALDAEDKDLNNTVSPDTNISQNTTGNSEGECRTNEDKFETNVNEHNNSKVDEEASITRDVEMKDDIVVEENDSNQTINENKRKLSTEDIEGDKAPKKSKLEGDNKCIRPIGVKRKYKGATFWPSDFRQKLCTCNVCISMYKDLSVFYLTDMEDTVTAYETLGMEKIDGAPVSQYEKGLAALSSLDRVQQINALTEYNKMKDKLLDFLKSFKDRKEIVKEEDIKAFFAGMKPKREPDGVYFCR